MLRQYIQAFPLDTWEHGYVYATTVRALVNASCVTRDDIECATSRLRKLYGRDDIREVLFALSKILEKPSYKRTRLFDVPKQRTKTPTSVLLEQCRRKHPVFPHRLMYTWIPELRRTDIDRALAELSVPDINSWPRSRQRDDAWILRYFYRNDCWVKDTATETARQIQQLFQQLSRRKPVHNDRCEQI